MSFLDDLNTESNFKTKPSSQCSVCKLINSVAGPEAEVLVARLADLNVPAAAIARVLIKNGYNIKGNTITRHRRKECLGA